MSKRQQSEPRRGNVPKRHKSNNQRGFSNLYFNDLKNCSGILVTCSRSRELQAIKEISDILCQLSCVEHAVSERNKLISQSSNGETESKDAVSSESTSTVSMSIREQLAHEVAAMQSETVNKMQLFRMVDMKISGLFAIQCHDCVNVVELSRELMNKVHLQQTGTTVTRTCTRFVPIQRFVPATTQDIIDNALELSAVVFGTYVSEANAIDNNVSSETGKTGVKTDDSSIRVSDSTKDSKNGLEAFTFAIRFTKRNNSVVDRKQIIDKVAAAIGSKHTVDLTNPQVAIIIQISKSIAGISVVSDYGSTYEFNMKTALAAAVDSQNE